MRRRRSKFDFRRILILLALKGGAICAGIRLRRRLGSALPPVTLQALHHIDNIVVIIVLVVHSWAN